MFSNIPKIFYQNQKIILKHKEYVFYKPFEIYF